MYTQSWGDLEVPPVSYCEDTAELENRIVISVLATDAPEGVQVSHNPFPVLDLLAGSEESPVQSAKSPQTFVAAKVPFAANVMVPPVSSCQVPTRWSSAMA
ncbi:hypothetical protein G6045_08660 [Streptomyces sp. YC504]|uniref:Uncharacterized protein n=1 Tax=Streptomyces mesophilus TaxID=1775132 RepID=A0A6G4XG97_9ACTN|nr:hypothetical protein [Streptomyces mesophilus]NGO75744.1 hypothetical protein [Streptomyces mesophilus]